MVEYNLSWYEVGMRYVAAILIIIPAAVFNIIPLVIFGMFVVLTGLLGMCPVKAVLFPNKKVEASKKVKRINTEKSSIAA